MVGYKILQNLSRLWDLLQVSNVLVGPRSLRNKDSSSIITEQGIEFFFEEIQFHFGALHHLSYTLAFLVSLPSPPNRTVTGQTY